MTVRALDYPDDDRTATHDCADPAGAVQQTHILVVDDDPLNVELLTSYLEESEAYTVRTAFSGAEALQSVALEAPDLIILDVMLPDLDGFTVCARLKSDPATRLIPVVMATALSALPDRLRGIEAGVDEFLTKPVNRPELLTRVRALLRAKQFADELESAEGVILALSRAIEARDGYTEQHTERVSQRALALGQRLRLPHEDLRVLEQGALLHDVGKIGIPEAILSKPGRLDDAEFAVMRRHPLIGVEICSALRSRLLRSALPVIRSHHEAVDGTGYPQGLRGDGIPLLARIVAVSDAYDAMTSDRPYRRGMPPERALAILAEGAGRQWDAALVQAFVGLDPAVLGPQARDDGTLLARLPA